MVPVLDETAQLKCYKRRPGYVVAWQVGATPKTLKTILGEQTAAPGSWVVTNEAGEVAVFTEARFHVLYMAAE